MMVVVAVEIVDSGDDFGIFINTEYNGRRRIEESIWNLKMKSIVVAHIFV